VSSNQRGESYLNVASLCPHLADVIVDRVEALNTHHWLFKMFLLIKNMKGIFDMIAAHI